MITCAIIDDELSAVELLESYAQRIPFMKVVFTSTSAIEGSVYLKTNSPNIVFLDINMPDLLGFDLAEIIGDKSKIIFTTAYSEYAIESYSYNAISYLLKPIPFDKFFKACQKAEAMMSNAAPVAAASTEPIKTTEGEEDFIYVKTDHKGKITKVAYKEILFIESDKNYVTIYTDKKDSIVTLLSLRELEQRLPEQLFFRCHKSFIVALKKIRTLDGNQITFHDLKDEVPLGASYRKAFLKLVGERIMGTLGKKLQ